MDGWKLAGQEVQQFLMVRPTAMRKQLAEYFGWGKMVGITVFSPPKQMGEIAFNTLILPPNDWSGMYYEGQELVIHARAAKGNRFERWKGITGPEATKNPIVIPVKKELTITPVFVPDDTEH